MFKLLKSESGVAIGAIAGVLFAPTLRGTAESVIPIHVGAYTPVAVDVGLAALALWLLGGKDKGMAVALSAVFLADAVTLFLPELKK